MKSLGSVCVFCGAREGNDPRYTATAQLLGETLAQQNVHLIYGGGQVGLMGHLAQAALDHNGVVTGVIPDFLCAQEVLHPDLSNYHRVQNLFARKTTMMDLADAFIVLPGGIGTLDEFVEAVTWRVLNQTSKPIGLLNVNDFFAPWAALFRHLGMTGFCDPGEWDKLIIETEVTPLLQGLSNACG